MPFAHELRAAQPARIECPDKCPDEDVFTKIVDAPEKRWRKGRVNYIKVMPGGHAPELLHSAGKNENCCGMNSLHIVKSGLGFKGVGEVVQRMAEQVLCLNCPGNARPLTPKTRNPFIGQMKFADTVADAQMNSVGQAY